MHNFESSYGMYPPAYQGLNVLPGWSWGTYILPFVEQLNLQELTNKRAAIWAGMTGLRMGAVWISDVMWWLDGASAQVNGPAPQAFSSRHPSGAIFVFCDGSTRFFPEGGDVEILRFLAGRDDGQIVSIDF